MGDSKISGFWKWLLILLVVCNLGLIMTIWIKPHSGEPGGRFEEHEHGHDRGGRRGMHRGPINFDRELNLTDAQRKQFDELRIAHEQRIDSIKQIAGRVREQFFDNLNAEAPDQAKLMALDAQLGDYHRQIELMTFNHFREVRALLDEQQKALFDKYIKGALKHMPEQPHSRNDGGPGGPGPGCGPDGRPCPPGEEPMGPPDDRK